MAGNRASQILLNCDLGEGFDDVDRKVMPLINQANIACGGHAGDRESVQNTVLLAVKRGVSIGAHPSYPDRKNFGRVSIAYAYEPLLQSLLEQVTLVDEACREQGSKLDYIKAHGALYNDSMKDPELMQMLLRIAKSFRCGLMVQALPAQTELAQHAKEQGIELIREGFADRAYADDGFLLSRKFEDALHNSIDKIAEQASKFAKGEPILSKNGRPLHISVDSICVHGDTDKAIEALKHIYDILH